MHRVLQEPITWLIAAFTLLGSTYAITTPLFEASDELWHYPMVQHLSRGGALPVQDPNNVGPWRQEASQPPLYYYLMGWATAWIDTSDMPQVRWLNPHVDNGIVTPDGNINLAIHTSAENFPWRGTVLAVRLVRLLSVLMGAGTVLFTYLLAREFFESEIERLSAAGFVAFVPMFLFISGAVNNDNLASLLSAIILFLLVRWSRSPSAIGMPQSAFLGLLLGLAALTKQSALGLYPLAGLTLAVRIYQQYRPLTLTISDYSQYALRLVKHALFVFVPALIIPGWWYYRNLVLYGDPLGWNAFIAVLGKRAAPASLLQLWGERESFARSYWGLFGGVNVPMSDWIYFVLDAFAVIAVVGLGVFVALSVYSFLVGTKLRLWARELADRMPRWFPYFLLLAHPALVFYGLIQWATVTWSSQGRLVFSGLSAIAVLMVIGMRTILPLRTRPVLIVAFLLFMGAISFAAPFVFIAPKYKDPPELTAAQIAAIPHPAEIEFGAPGFPAEMRLMGFSIDVPGVLPGSPVKVTLYWRSLVAMDRDWSVFVHVVDENGVVVAQRDTYPGLGLMPTRKWAVGQTLADTYIIPVPPTTYAPSDAKVEIGLYDYHTQERLLIASELSQDAGQDAAALAPLTIAAAPGDLPNPQSLNFGGQIELVGYDMDRRALAPGEALTLTLYWRGLRPMHTNYSVFAHVRGKGESLWAQHDSWPLDGAAPTAAWKAGDLITDVRTLTLRPDAAPGVYDVEIGLYDDKGSRLQLVLPDGRLTDNFVYLSKIRVLP